MMGKIERRKIVIDGHDSILKKQMKLLKQPKHKISSREN